MSIGSLKTSVAADMSTGLIFGLAAAASASVFSTSIAFFSSSVLAAASRSSIALRLAFSWSATLVWASLAVFSIT